MRKSKMSTINNVPMKFITTEQITEFRNIFDLYDKKKKGVLERDQFLK
jgi:Ca2+-binding EF-hand superfamily protein